MMQGAALRLCLSGGRAARGSRSSALLARALGSARFADLKGRGRARAGGRVAACLLDAYPCFTI